MPGEAFHEWLRREGRTVTVGASPAGLGAAEALRAGGAGSLTMIGDEPHEPYDRPPLSKACRSARPQHTEPPRRREVDAAWRLGAAAAGLGMAARRVRPADGEEAPYGRLLIATGVRARP